MYMASAAYWRKIGESMRSLAYGLRLTFRHLMSARRSVRLLPVMDNDYFHGQRGIATIQYPHEVLPVPDNGRYRLHNEIDDCIVCDKCAKVCPVNCIYIEPVRAVEEFGRTSDGTPKRIYAAKFDIDMGKCCFCGLCTTVCPTECLTMTRVYDFSVTDIREHNFVFAEMSPAEIEEKKRVFAAHQESKAKPGEPPAEKRSDANQGPARPVFRPKIKPPGQTPEN